MLKFYFHPTPNPTKVALFLAEAELPFELVPVNTAKGEQHDPAFRVVNPNGKLPAIDDDGTIVFDSNAILLYLAEKTGKFLGRTSDRGDLLSWLMFIATGLGPFSGQSVHFQHAAPEKIPYALNRYLREAERHYDVLDKRLQGREFIVGDSFTIVDIAAWAWVNRADLVLGAGRRGEFPQRGALVPVGECPSRGRPRTHDWPGCRVQSTRRRGLAPRALPEQLRRAVNELPRI